MSSYVRFDSRHQIEVTEGLEDVHAAVSATGGMNVPMAQLTRLDGTPVLVHSRSIRTVSAVEDPPPGDA